MVAVWAGVMAVPFVAVFRRPAVEALVHVAVADYLPFVILLASLFSIGSCIHVRGTLRGTPAVNAAIMLIGVPLASCVGTTGASVLLIRPLLRANRRRRYRAHTVVFFIFLVANIGGALTPLGDPPLFLGFLHGVPFLWTLTLWRPTALATALTLAAYIGLDSWHWRREAPDARAHPEGRHEPVRIEGSHNLVFLAGVLAAVMLSGIWRPGEVSLLGVPIGLQHLVRDAVLIAMAAASWLTTRHETRARNEHTWEPIREVAIVFAGIFVTMTPVLRMLAAGEAGALAFMVRSVGTPAAFFWATGGLSTVLDNAPTYLTFLSTAVGRLHPGEPEGAALLALIAGHPAYLRAIATGAVFMGAGTYIGNAPNFMVRSIAASAGVDMPSFLGYIARFTIPGPPAGAGRRQLGVLCLSGPTSSRPWRKALPSTGPAATGRPTSGGSGFGTAARATKGGGSRA